MGINKDNVVEELGQLLEHAVRTSIAKGAQYAPGEDVDFDTKTAWIRVAKNLFKLVEVVIDEQKHVMEKRDGTD